MARTAQSVTVTEFKAKCLRLVDELGPRGLVLTKRGRPVARVVPIGVRDNRALIGALKGRIDVVGDIFSTGVAWDAQPRHARARRSPRRRSHTA